MCLIQRRRFLSNKKKKKRNSRPTNNNEMFFCVFPFLPFSSTTFLPCFSLFYGVYVLKTTTTTTPTTIIKSNRTVQMPKCIQISKIDNQYRKKPTDNPHPSTSGAAPLAQLLVIFTALPTMLLILPPTTHTA